MIQSVRLVSFSKPSEDFSEELNDCQDLISFCARVSNPSNQLNTETTEKLLRYMIKYKHWSPFEKWNRKQAGITKLATQAYQWAIENNIAKEQARAVLPEGLTVSRMYMNGTLRSWIHYIELRTEAGTQKEHRIIAEKCGVVISKILPLITEFQN